MPTGKPPVSLDLVPTDVVAPRLKKIALGAIVLGIIVAAAAAIFLPLAVALLLGAVVAAPVAVSAWVGLRRRIWLADNVVHVRGGLRTKRLNVPGVVTAEIGVRTARIDQVSLRLNDGNTRVTIALALYTEGGGRELPILALRGLADALWTSELVPAAAIASVLVDQLKAEARDAGLNERPLYRAVRSVRASGRTPLATLTDREVAELTG